MSYLSLEEKKNYIKDLRDYCETLMNSEETKRREFLLNYSLYSRENILQEWFNIINIIRYTGNCDECNTVVKWREIYKDINDDYKIKPRAGSKSILIIYPDITQEIDISKNNKKLNLQWSKSHVFPFNKMIIPSELFFTRTSVIETINNLGCIEELDENITLRNMVDWKDTGKFVNYFLNELVFDKNNCLLIKYTKKEFHFYYLLLQSLFAVYSDIYDSDDVEQTDITIPDIILLKGHDPFFIFHDITFIIRRFNVYICTCFEQFIIKEKDRQHKNKMMELINRNIAQRITDTK
ncbi:hypothetical protein [Thomasclavelia spiroformis]|uniref:hypothetical protein n=1 Tax=Thomasclavelia spiroformis TaxID=29348 RepID=UPI0024B10BCE|nr:hypothetical protein [Thomasclavelia spiroformis]